MNISPEEIRLVDLVRELGLEMNAVENWIGRDQLPIDIIRPGQGSAVRVAQEDAELLAIFLVVAHMIGPTFATAVLEGLERFGSTLEIEVAVTTVRVNLVPIKAAVIRAENRAREAA